MFSPDVVTYVIAFLVLWLILLVFFGILLWLREKFTRRDHVQEDSTSAVEGSHGTDRGQNGRPGESLSPKISVSFVTFDRLSFWQKRALKKQAVRDFRNARGFAHRKMLRDIARRLKRDAKRIGKSIANEQNLVTELSGQEQRSLRQELERHLLHNHLQEASGIGPALRDRILSELRAERLSDLRRAQIVHGVGESRQQDINRWVQKYQSRLPTLIREQFPGSDHIRREFEQRRRVIEEQLVHLEKEQERIKTQYTLVQAELKWLDAVRVDDFVLALKDNEEALRKAERFIVGVFPEWEPVPRWFREAMKQEG